MANLGSQYFFSRDFFSWDVFTRPSFSSAFFSPTLFIPALVISFVTGLLEDSRAFAEPVEARGIGFFAAPSEGATTRIPLNRSLDNAGEAEARGGVLLRIRTVRASGALEDTKSGAAQNVDPRLSDIAQRLTKLAYRNFTLADSRRDEVTMRRRQSIDLIDGFSLTLRPSGLEGDRLSIWLKWLDHTGTVLLDSRMNVSCGDPIIAGTEITDDAGVLLIIDAKLKSSDDASH